MFLPPLLLFLFLLLILLLILLLLLLFPVISAFHLPGICPVMKDNISQKCIIIVNCINFFYKIILFLFFQICLLLFLPQLNTTLCFFLTLELPLAFFIRQFTLQNHTQILFLFEIKSSKAFVSNSP